MLKLSILVVSTVMSFAVGYGADALGCDMFVSFLLSGVGAIFGCWLGWWLYKRFLE
jgi:MFS-type transporter involved in bile tolerance (Atg22 family)